MRSALRNIELGRARLQSCRRMIKRVWALAPEVKNFGSNRFCSRPKFLSLFAFTTFLLLTCFVVAGKTAVSYQQPNDSSHQKSSLSQQLGKESREAAGEDDQTQFKHSWSVQKLSEYTHLSIEHAYWLSIFLNFAGIGLLIHAFYKWGIPTLIPPPGPYMRQRTVLIQQAMEEGRKASAEANRRLAEIEGQLSKLDSEIAGMRAAAESEGAAEEQRIMAAAAEDGRKIVASAEQEIAAAARAARRELTAYAADLAVSLAKRQIHVDAATDQALVRAFAQQLPGNGGETWKGEH